MELIELVWNHGVSSNILSMRYPWDQSHLIFKSNLQLFPDEFDDEYQSRHKQRYPGQHKHPAGIREAQTIWQYIEIHLQLGYAYGNQGQRYRVHDHQIDEQCEFVF